MNYYRNPSSLFHDFKLLSNLVNEVSRAFDESRTSSGYPKVNVYVNNDGMTINAKVPGINPKTVDISVKGDKLGIVGEVSSRTKGENEIYHRGERPTGKFQRELTLPFNVDTDNIKASYTNGILILNLSRREEDKLKKIEVKVS